MPSARFDDVAFLNDPKHWPNWPICPVKKYSGAAGSLPDCGIVFADQPTVVVYVVFIWDLGPNTPELLKNAVKHEYASFSEMVQAGWMVD